MQYSSMVQVTYNEEIKPVAIVVVRLEESVSQQKIQLNKKKFNFMETF